MYRYIYISIDHRSHYILFESCRSQVPPARDAVHDGLLSGSHLCGMFEVDKPWEIMGKPRRIRDHL